MFDSEEVVSLTPWLFRHFPRSAIVKGRQERSCKTVTEEVLMEVCQEVSPEKYLEQTMKALDEFKTK